MPAIRPVTRARLAYALEGLIETTNHGMLSMDGSVSPSPREYTLTLRQRILPLAEAQILHGGLSDDDDAASLDEQTAKEDGATEPLWDYEPAPEELLKRLIPDFVEITVYRALLESAASEMGAKMTAMRSASDNASEMIKNLTLEMNRQRQAAITQEILEVVGGAEGL